MAQFIFKVSHLAFLVNLDRLTVDPDEAGHRTSVAPTSTRRTAGRRRTLVDSESEIEADPADLDADAEYKPYVKGNSVPVKKENEFPSLFPPEPRLILVLRTKPGHLIEFPPGISGPDDDDYQRGEVWGPHEGEPEKKPEPRPY
jgi:hypothetical protein